MTRQSTHAPTAHNGFTLIELLVVIAIIGLLSSVVLASLNSARIKAKDTHLAAELVSLRSAFFMTSQAKSEIIGPMCTPQLTACVVSDLGGNASLDNELTPLVTSGYISKVPHYVDWPSNLDVIVLYMRAGYTYNPITNTGLTIEYWCGGPAPNPASWNPSSANDNAVIKVWTTAEHNLNLPVGVSTCQMNPLVNGGAKTCSYSAQGTPSLPEAYCLQL